MAFSYLTKSRLLNLFMIRVLVAVRAELFEFQASRRVATVLLSGVTTHAIRALIGVATALGALKRNYKTDAFCHDLSFFISTQSSIIAYTALKWSNDT